MSVEALSLALNFPGVNAAERLVLIGIANHDGDGGSWPSMATLARYACVTERSVQRTIARLVERGLVSVSYNEGGTIKTRADRRPNSYVLHLERGDTGVGSSRGDTGVAHGVTLVSPEPSFNRPPPLPPKGGRHRRRQEHECRRDYDHAPLTPEEIAEKYGVEP